MDDTAVNLETPLGRLRGVAERRGPACVLYVHGFGSEHRGSKAQDLRRACAAAGMGFAAFDFRGHGASSGTMRDLRASGLQADLDAVADHLRAERLYLFGSSMGG
ncbi:MAG: alpha/beta hydrolase, partial [Gemmataceae bacterium]|nr:alpha/beta hydrolase [Gemmataceae bacterium]